MHMPTSSFRFSGKNGEHELTLKCSLWGRERYLVDGKHVLSVWSGLPTGVRELRVDGRNLKIVYTIKSWMTRADAFVDGEQVANDMFAEFNREFVAQLGSWAGAKVMLPFFLAGAAVAAAGIFLVKTPI